MDGIRFLSSIFSLIALLILPVIWIISLAWVHYPQGIIKAIKGKRKKNTKSK